MIFEKYKKLRAQLRDRGEMKRLLPFVWVAVLGLLVLLGAQLQGQSTQFFGIADESEQNIRFSYPVEVVEVLVTEAAAVELGTPLLKINRPSLNAELKLIDDQIRTATAVYQGGVGNLGVKLKERIAERAAKLAELDVQIQALRSRRALNQRLLKEISGGPARQAAASPLSVELDALLEQRRYVDSSMNEQIAGLRAQMAGNTDPFEAQLAELQNRKAELERQRKDLSVVASLAGRVGSINARPGEQVAPFRSILTVHSESPRFVKGYIHESVYNELTVGQSVSIQPIRPTESALVITGQVESLGSRIIEYPERLNRNPRLPAWGREVLIGLPKGSQLMMGEKVILSTRLQSWSERLVAALTGLTSAAKSNARPKSATAARPIRSRVTDLDAARLEPSGIVAQPNRDRFLVISDELPQILVMNSSGEIIGSKPLLNGPSIDDIESITAVGDDIFIAASLSFAKNGKRGTERCQLLRLRESPAGYVSTGSLNLCVSLQQLAGSADDAETRQFLERAIAERSIDVEALAVRNDELFLGFKTPLDQQNRTVIVSLGPLSALLAGAAPQGHIWQRVALKDPADGKPARLSDMVLRSHDALLLAISHWKKEPTSTLWSWKEGQLRPLTTIVGLRAEGVSDRLINDHLLLVFDGGGTRRPRYLPITGGA